MINYDAHWYRLNKHYKWTHNLNTVMPTRAELPIRTSVNIFLNPLIRCNT